jgi:hypothetical protein
LGGFNEAAGRYAVDLARALGLITANNVWTDKGFLVDIIADVRDNRIEDQLSLTLAERLLHFLLFFEGDGAALIFLSQYLLRNGSIPSGRETLNSIATSMFVDVLGAYLQVTSNTSDRVKLRTEIQKLTRSPYKGKTGSHKIFLHAQVLYRLGLANRVNGGSRMYQVANGPVSTRTQLESLVTQVSDPSALEKAIQNHKTLEIAALVLGIPCAPWDEKHRVEALKRLASFYKHVESTGAPLCSISTIVGALQISLLTTGKLLTFDQGFQLVTDLQREHPKAVRFHVDRRGQPAFLKMSDEMAERLAS